MGNRVELSVVIPVYNGSKSLEKLCEKILQSVEGVFESCEIILVDDGSKDDSYRVMQNLRESDSRIGIIKLRRNVGQQNATFCGIVHAGGSIIATLDDDLQHPPSLLSAMREEIDNGAELVFAVPNRRRQKRYRQLGSKMTYLLFNLAMGKRRFVRISSCRMFTSELKSRMDSAKNEFVYVSAELLKHTDSIAWLEFGHAKRLHGQSNYTFAKLVGVFFRLMVYYSEISVLKKFRKQGELFEIEEINLEGDAAL